MKIAFLDAKTVGEVTNIHKFGELGEFISYPLTPKSKVIERLQNVDVIITNKVVIDKQIMEACPTLKLICIAATGTNNIDLDYAWEKGIPVKNVAGYSTESVAQSTFAMLFYLMNKTKYFDEYVKSGEYCKSDIFTHHAQTITELNGKVFGIIGLGTIGNRVADIAAVFGSRIVYYSTSGKNRTHKKFQHMELDELLKASDVISIHCPLNDRTRGMIDLKKLNLMKPSAFILNMGRGGIVNEYDLAHAIDAKIIAGAGIDVMEHEPIQPDNPLLKIRRKENLIITPHIAWASIESRTALIDKIYQNILMFSKSNNM